MVRTLDRLWKTHPPWKEGARESWDGEYRSRLLESQKDQESRKWLGRRA